MEAKLMLHQRDECKPCAYFHYKKDGCRQGDDCEFCHLCAPGALKERKKLRYQQMKAESQLSRTGRRRPGLDDQRLVSNRRRDDMIMQQTFRKGQHDKSEDETTQAPSETEMTDTKLFTAPPGLQRPNVTDMMFAAPPGQERPGLSSTLAMHGLPQSPVCGSGVPYGDLNEPTQPAYFNLRTPMNFRAGAVSVSFVSL